MEALTDPEPNHSSYNSYLVFVSALEHPPLCELAGAADLEAELAAAVTLHADPLARQQAPGHLCNWGSDSDTVNNATVPYDSEFLEKYRDRLKGGPQVV